MADWHTNAAREAAQRDMLQLVQQNARLKQRQAQLEQLVREYYRCWQHLGNAALDQNVERYRVVADEMPALQARARALLEQEDK